MASGMRNYLSRYIIFVLILLCTTAWSSEPQWPAFGPSGLQTSQPNQSEMPSLRIGLEFDKGDLLGIELELQKSGNLSDIFRSQEVVDFSLGQRGEFAFIFEDFVYYGEQEQLFNMRQIDLRWARKKLATVTHASTIDFRENPLAFLR